MNRARRDVALVALYALAVAVAAFLLSRDSLIIQDGDALFDMTRSFWRSGTFEVPNGLDVHDSLDLVLRQTTTLVPHHMYGKYPPLYAVLAAAPVGLLGIRGMYLLNAVGLAATIVLYYAIARQVLSRRLSAASASALPFVVPLFPYGLMELPHLVSAALVLLALLASFAQLRRSDARGAFGLALASGLVVGVAVGVRLQNVTVGAVLVAFSALRARRRAVSVVGQIAGQGACILLMAVLNRDRFGGLVPFSYGWNAIGPNPDTEGTHYYFSHPIVPIAVAWTAAVVLGLRRASKARNAERVGTYLALASALAWPALRHQLARMLSSASVLVVTTAFVHEPPTTTFGWLNKSLLASSPLLVLGVLVTARAAWKRPRVELEVAAATCFAMILFLSLRNPDPSTRESVIGFLSISPRYLVELFPLFLLLASSALADVSLGMVFISSAVAFAVPLVVLFIQTNDDEGATRRFVLLSLSLGIAAVLGFVELTKSFAPIARWRPAALGVAVGYACVVTLFGDSDALVQITRRYARWSRRVEAVTPQRFTLVGWDDAKDPIYAIRERRDVVFVNASVDDSRSLLATMDAFRARGRPAYYFGLGMEKVRPMIEARYAIVPILGDPLLWRLDPRSP